MRLLRLQNKKSIGCLLDSFFQIEACGGQAITFGGDVSKEADVEAMIKAVSKYSICFNVIC